MIGTIIGNLAAWTWENDYEKFLPILDFRESIAL